MVKFHCVLQVSLSLWLGCSIETSSPEIDGQAIAVRFIHTTDIHSRLFPYRMEPPYTDETLGLLSKNAPFGGVARIAFIIKQARRQAYRSLYLDSGDIFQGAPVFNVFHGEPEIKALSLMGLDAMAAGNHDFDLGEPNLATWIRKYATFPVLAANYIFAPGQGTTEPPLADLVNDYVIFNLKGLRVLVIGLGNTSTMTTLFEAGNKLGITVLDAPETVQNIIDSLKPQVDVIVVLSHLGLTEDQELIKNTTGIDIVFGGHHHVVLNPPKVVMDCQIAEMSPTWKERFLVAHKDCSPRPVPLVHSGAFAKYVGILDVVFKQKEKGSNDWEVASYKYEPKPVDSTVPEDSLVKEMLEPYMDKLRQKVMVELILAYAPTQVSRFGSRRGDSQLGNLVATAMRRRQGVETDFALTNTLGIRTDIFPGPVTIDDMYNVFPFENTITVMYLSGSEVVQLFDYVARRSAQRGCNAQAQVDGVRARLQCGGCDVAQRPKEWQEREETRANPDDIGCALSIEVGGNPVRLDAQYNVAVNDYIANGGSGFTVLKRNTTKIDTKIPQRDALMDFIRQGKPCGAQGGALKPCTTDEDCSEGYLCACKGRVFLDKLSGDCALKEACDGGGVCVLEKCKSGVAQILKEQCIESKQCECDMEEVALLQCSSVACLDENLGAKEDGRLELILGSSLTK